jgi:hypothetical protein
MSSDRPLVKEVEGVEITPEMIRAGVEAALCEMGGAELGGRFSYDEMVCLVYWAMDIARLDASRFPFGG